MNKNCPDCGKMLISSYGRCNSGREHQPVIGQNGTLDCYRCGSQNLVLSYVCNNCSSRERTQYGYCYPGRPHTPIAMPDGTLDCYRCGSKNLTIEE